MSPSSPSLEPSLKQILVVDDEDIVRIALRETLRRERYGVTACPSPEEALKALQKEAFAVIISDYQMPGMTGLDFLAKAKQIQPDATRILITAVLSLDTVIEAINKGEIYRFIVKPWIREELLATVRNAVQRHELIVRNTVLQATTLAMNEQLVTLNKALESRANAEAEQRRRLAELNSALELNLHHSVQLCLKVLQSFHPALGTQARRVFGLCRAMADTLRLSEQDRQTLELAAWLHDIGLVGTPRGLIRKWLQKKEKLTPNELSQIEQHPILGEELVDFVAHLQPVGRVIRGHHEQFDGRGYPDRLGGKEIPWLSRVLAVAVAYAELPAPHAEAVENVTLGSGWRFDPEAVRVLLRSLPNASLPRQEREISPSELAAGMTLAAGVKTLGGMLLAPAGQVLTEAQVEAIRNHHQLETLAPLLLVYAD
ncbi:MAG: Cyclic di-GMP phosphodiesterase response regulator RpfG [Verrucomicrobiota bacterium]|jgi:response regulator RpfG family c-di-GMP phosphodiesterase